MHVIPAEIQTFLRQHAVQDIADRHQLVSLVQAVANIPWGEGRTIDEVLTTKHVGTCTGKHLVLAACFDALGIPYRTVVCSFLWSEQGIALPQHLYEILQEGEWRHGHNFMQIPSSAGEWIDIDITWDPTLRPFGFLALPEDWDGETSFVGLQSMIERTNDAPIELKKEWLKSLTPALQERRERFLAAFFAWIKELRR